jgi:hypothetical protein
LAKGVRHENIRLPLAKGAAREPSYRTLPAKRVMSMSMSMLFPKEAEEVNHEDVARLKFKPGDVTLSIVFDVFPNAFIWEVRSQLIVRSKWASKEASSVNIFQTRKQPPFREPNLKRNFAFVEAQDVLLFSNLPIDGLDSDATVLMVSRTYSHGSPQIITEMQFGTRSKMKNCRCLTNASGLKGVTGVPAGGECRCLELSL